VNPTATGWIYVRWMAHSIAKTPPSFHCTFIQLQKKTPFVPFPLHSITKTHPLQKPPFVPLPSLHYIAKKPLIAKTHPSLHCKNPPLAKKPTHAKDHPLQKPTPCKRPPLQKTFVPLHKTPLHSIAKIVLDFERRSRCRLLN
jgi:hypothetical protein